MSENLNELTMLLRLWEWQNRTPSGESYEALNGEDGWYIQDTRDGLLYEASCDLSEIEAKYLARCHSLYPDIDYEKATMGMYPEGEEQS